MSHDKDHAPIPPADEQEAQQRIEAFHQFMQECGDCQKEVAIDWHFCAHCGTRLEIPCPGCGVPLPPAGAKACASCGLAIPQLDT